MFHVGHKHVEIYGGFAGNEVSISQRDILNHPTMFYGEVGGADSTDNLYTLLFLESTGVPGTHVVDGIVFQESNSTDYLGILLAALTAREDVNVRNCRFLHNRGIRGGGITSFSTVQVDKTLFMYNVATQQGGGAYAGGGQVAYSNCTFRENASPYGGGLKIEYGPTNEISNCIFANNSGSGLGGAIQFYFCGANIYNCTFYNNYSTMGHAIGVYDVYYVRVSNSILWNSNNTAAIGNANGNTVSATHCITNESYAGAGNITDTPLFKDTLYSVFIPLSCSPAVNAGINDSVFVSEDNFAATRIEDGTVDIGALEYATPVLNNATTNLYVTTSGPTFQWVDCNNAFSAVAGATSSFYYPSVPGSYAVVLSQGGCSDTTVCETVTTVGMDEVEKSLIRVYPNPSQGVISILSDYSKGMSIEVFDVAGRLVDQVTLQNGIMHYALPEMKGIYFLRFSFSDGVETHRIVRE
jgi:hypothetical protein